MRKFVALLFTFGSLTALAQDVPTSAPSTPSTPIQTTPKNNTLTSLAGEFFEGDFFNAYAFASAVYDSTQQTLQGGRNGGPGFNIGGGVTLSKTFSDSLLSLNYRGDFRDYSSGYEGSGTDQYLSLIYTKRLSNRWSLSLQESAGILFYTNAYFSSLTPSGGTVQSNPFSPTTRFISSGVTVAYRQSQRLTYTFSGDFFLNRYSYPGSIGSTGGIASASATYQLTARTSFGGTYSHDNFVYEHNAGSAVIDGGYGFLSHTFGRNWNARASVGVTRVHSSGLIDLPVELVIGGQPVIGYEIGHYDTKTLVPTFVGTLIHSLGHYTVSASGGHSVNPGNGTYLTSSSTFFGGVVSRSFRKSTLSASINFSRLSSISNTVSQSYSTTFINGSYSRMLYPHLSGYIGYQFERYGSLLTYTSSSLNRIIIGVNFSTKNIPMTQF